ncbi:MAG: hypothetical protein EO766_06645 [Hydrotalea sp. AMD]|uniref:hypothetical protein n=1 Tax=Hydrotalea TaxID=1004300 RepID=UPI0009BF2FAD|nr:MULTISPECIES: hypothetical protein [Hydrotalea]RWZ88822.1 MAG: hypothetical protein EO766_06645 [Hydrotalea sp. AMD]
MINKIAITMLGTFSFILSIVQLYAQNDTTRSNEFSFGINGVSRFQYFGRTDSLQSSGMVPYIGYQLKCGLYAQGSFIFLENSTTSLNYTGALGEIGYRFQSTKNFSGNIFFTKLFYNENSTLVQSALQYQSGLNAAYTNKIINFNFGADLKFSNKTDIGISPGLDHIFILKIRNKIPMALAIDPTAYAYFGTQNFSRTYLEKSSILFIPISQQTVTDNSVKFNLLSYEFSVPIVFVAGKFNINITPSYTIPMNLIPGEYGKNLFYITFGLGVRI